MTSASQKVYRKEVTLSYHLSCHGVVFLDGGEEVVVAGGHDARSLLQDTLQEEHTKPHWVSIATSYVSVPK